MDSREKLLEVVKRKAVSFGDFVLASGKRSSYYIDARLATLDGDGVRYLAEVILERLDGTGITAIGGMTLGADPIVGAVIALSSLRGTPLKGFIVRKEAKSHGTQKLVEGELGAADRVALVEDVVTTGGSVLKAADAVEALGAKVEVVLSIVDRNEGGREAIAARGYRFVPIFSLEEILER